MELSKLAPPKGAKKRKLRVGRGENSGHGKTSGRGGKGQTARTGSGRKPGFEGGQMPLFRRIPKRGFISRLRAGNYNKFQLVSLAELEALDAGSTITIESLSKAGVKLGHRSKAGIKIISNGKLSKKLHVQAHAFTNSARAAIEALGGTAEVVQKQ